MPSTIRGGVREILYTIIQKFKEKQEERKALLMQKINCLVTVTKFIENLDVHVDKSVLENVKQLKEVEETEFSLPDSDVIFGRSIFNDRIVHDERLGPAVKYTLTISCEDKDNRQETVIYNIDNLVEIRFHINYFRSGEVIDLKILTRKIGETEQDTKVNVTCSNRNMPLPFSKQWLCTGDTWSEKIVGRINRLLFGNSIASFTVEIIVIASKVTMMGSTLYRDENFLDFKLSAADGSVGVHKVSLGTHSDMFRTMLNGEWKETVEGHIEVPGASVQTLQALKDFLYLGTLPDEGLQTLLQIAIRFFIESLKRECIIKLAQNVKADDYLQLLDYARDNQVIELTFALMQLTPKEVIQSAYEAINKDKVSEVAE